MRILILISLFACSALGAAEMWRWVDKDGVIHYQDQPAPGAEKITVSSAPRVGTTAPAPARSGQSSVAPREFRYASCAIGSPAQDETFNNVNSVSASITLTPGLRPGDRVLMTLNGRKVDNWPDSATGYVLTGLFRGSYSLGAQVLDEGGRSICNSPPVAFHIRQPSLLSPARPKLPKPTGP